MAVASGDCSMAVRKCSSVEDRRFSMPMSPFFSEAPDERCQPPLCRNCRRHSPKGVEEAVELPRIPIPRTSVNRGQESGLSVETLAQDRSARQTPSYVLRGFPSRKMRAHASPRTPRYPRELILCRYRLSHRHLAQARLVQHDDAARPRCLDETGLPELAHGLGDGLARARHHTGEVVVAQAHPQSPPPATLLPEALR